MSYAFRFGTAGIRARLGSAQTELNRESVRVIAHAIVTELLTLAEDARTRGVVVAFDGRRESRSFAYEVSGVALAQGLIVGLFERETPTPLLAFTTRTRGSVAGIMITASHNPADDNGIKLYLEGGRQVSAPYDARIEARIAAACEPASIARDDLDTARGEGRLIALGEHEIAAYLARIRELVPGPAANAELSFAYSALYGVGTELTRRLVREFAPLRALEVAAHATLRADFGGLASPNPEEPLALADLRELAEREQLDLAFAHDPDADRLAVLARAEDGRLRSLSGDEVGALLGDFLLSQHPAPESTLLASTLVSGGLLEQIAHSYGAQFVRTATGFKWIAALGRERARVAQRELLFGYEEALGYAFFAMAEDKDGIAALAVLCRLAQNLRAEGESLCGKLAALSRQHGAFSTRQISISAQGGDARERLAIALEGLRALSAETLLGPGATLVDYEKEPAGAFPLLVFAQQHGPLSGTRVCVRPSGTEAKLKIYLHAREPVAADDLDGARARAEARLTLLANKLAPYLSA